MSEWRGNWIGISSDLCALLSTWELPELHAFLISCIGSSEADVFHIWSNWLSLEKASDDVRCTFLIASDENLIIEQYYSLHFPLRITFKHYPFWYVAVQKKNSIGSFVFMIFPTMVNWLSKYVLYWDIYVLWLCFMHTDQTFTTILRSIYDLLGSSMFVHQPITDENIEKHSALIFDKLDSHHSGTINLDDFENYCLHVSCR